VDGRGREEKGGEEGRGSGTLTFWEKVTPLVMALYKYVYYYYYYYYYYNSRVV